MPLKLANPYQDISQGAKQRQLGVTNNSLAQHIYFFISVKF